MSTNMPTNRRVLIGMGIGAVGMPLLTLVFFLLLGSLLQLPEVGPLFYAVMIVPGLITGLVVGFLAPSSWLLQAALGAGMGALTGGFLVGPLQIVIGAIVGLIIGVVVQREAG